MKILVADDDLVSRGLLESYLKDWGYSPLTADDGREALALLKGSDAPPLAILDWMMPYFSGPELCRELQALQGPVPSYIILVTSKTDKRDIVRGLEAGARDYVTKPYDAAELRARVDVGKKVVELQELLHRRITELEQAAAQIRQLRGLLPICYRCKKVRDDAGYWSEVETYVAAHSDATFTHALCPGCYPAAMAAVRQDAQVK